MISTPLALAAWLAQLRHPDAARVESSSEVRGPDGQRVKEMLMRPCWRFWFRANIIIDRRPISIREEKGERRYSTNERLPGYLAFSQTSYVRHTESFHHALTLVRVDLSTRLISCDQNTLFLATPSARFHRMTTQWYSKMDECQKIKSAKGIFHQRYCAEVVPALACDQSRCAVIIGWVRVLQCCVLSGSTPPCI